MDFKQRVHREVINCATIYKSVFVDYDYLIYSSTFKEKPYYIVSASEDNYPHLTGVHSLISAQDFYIRCLDGTLQETDFEIEGENKGSVRRKIKILPLLSTLFSDKLYAEESFSKGKIHCSLATSDDKLTLGFVDTTLLRPKTLLKSNELNPMNTVNITLVLRRNRGSEKFDTIIQGDVSEFNDLHPNIFLSHTKKNLSI